MREGDPADAFYLLTSGTARVVKRGTTGEEVPLGVLHARRQLRRDGAAAGRDARTATVRASSPVEALRLDGTVFAALTRTHPEVRSMFEAIANVRSLANFLR